MLDESECIRINKVIQPTFTIVAQPTFTIVAHTMDDEMSMWTCTGFL